MQTFTSAMRMIFCCAFLCMALVAILWGLLPAHRLFLQSLLVGMAASLVNGAVLLSKTWRVGQAAVDPATRPKGTGMMQRLLVVSFAVYLTVRFPASFTLSGVLIGLFLIQILSLLFVYRSFK